ncbi:MAG: 2-amino-4-hydroxy-6-hydroxymethyldihydropteridine diphosphokinase [Lysobacterales bacterium]
MPERERVYLSLGSNIDPEMHLAGAIAALRHRFGELQQSPVYRNPAVGYAGADFLNLAVAIDCELSPDALAAWLHALESAHGRRRDLPRFSDRPLDIDIVLFGNRQFRGPGNLQVPRPELGQAFVLKPLADLAPDLTPVGSTVTLAALWARHPESGMACWRQGHALA